MLILMPHTTGDPLPKVRIIRRREESPIRLLTRQSLFGRDAIFGLRCFIVALLRLHLPPVVRLSLLSVIHKECQRGRQADDDQTLEDAVVDFVVVVVVSAGHAFGEGLVVVVVVVCAVVVRVGFFEEVGDPFAEGPFFFGFCECMLVMECSHSLSC